MPHEAGKQEMPDRLDTSLDLASIKASLVGKGDFRPLDIGVSEDPGRYIEMKASIEAFRASDTCADSSTILHCCSVGEEASSCTYLTSMRR
jgi:hypothetical protein